MVGDMNTLVSYCGTVQGAGDNWAAKFNAGVNHVVSQNISPADSGNFAVVGGAGAQRGTNGPSFT